MNVLDIMEIIKDFDVKKVDFGYQIDSKQEEVAALINSKLEIKFYVTGTYNSGSDWVEINMGALKKLQDICEYIVEIEFKESI